MRSPHDCFCNFIQTAKLCACAPRGFRALPQDWRETPIPFVLSCCPRCADCNDSWHAAHGSACLLACCLGCMAVVAQPLEVGLAIHATQVQGDLVVYLCSGLLSAVLTHRMRGEEGSIALNELSPSHSVGDKRRCLADIKGGYSRFQGEDLARHRLKLRTRFHQGRSACGVFLPATRMLSSSRMTPMP